MTIPPDAPIRRDAEATRRRLVRAALELFTSIGFRATTTPMLAERAGVAEGTIYRHFAGKDELFNAVYRETQEWGLRLLTESETDRIPVRDRLQQVARRILDEAGRDGPAVRMLLAARDDRYLDAPSRESARYFREALELVIASGKSDGVVRAGPAELWAAVWLAVVSFAAERIGAGEWDSGHPQAALALDAAWDAIAAARDPIPPR